MPNVVLRNGLCNQPIATLLVGEATNKLGSAASIDVMRPLQAFNAGGRAKAAKQIIDVLAAAKEAGVNPATALRLVNWE